MKTLKSNVWKYGIVLVCVIVVVVMSLGCLQREMQRSDVPEISPNPDMPFQDDPFMGTFVGSENVSLNQSAKIKFTICPLEDAPNTTIRLLLPPDVEIVGGNTEWCGDVKSGEEVQVEVVIQVSIKMRGNIKASVERPVNEVKIWRSYYYLISTIEEEDHVSESRQIVVEMPKQDDPFKGSFVDSQTPHLNQVAQITFSVIPEEDMPNSTIKFFLPPDVELVEGDLGWHGDLKEGQQISLDLFVDVTEEVEQNIKADAFTYIDGIKITRSYYFHVSTVDKAAFFSTTEQKGTMVMQTMAKSSNMSSQPTPNLESTGYITVIGRFEYVNDDGGFSPMRYVYTELWDSEFGLDEYLGYGYTDNDGNFYYYVNNDDGWLQGGRDVYVIAYAYSDAAKTTTDANDTYWVATPIKNDVLDGGVDFGSWYPTLYGEAWEAVDAAWSEYIWIYSQVGWIRSQVHIKWPSGTWPVYTWTSSSTGEITDQWMELPDKSTKEWNHVTVHHEYGHAVMIEAYGTNEYNLPTYGSYPSHWASMESDEGFAIIEGWAEFMQCVIDNDPNNLQNWGQNIETNDWYNKQDSSDFDGDIVEGSFASILWDIFDPANDDGLNMGFDEIWTIMLNDRPGSIHDIWDDWFTRGYGHDQALWQIYYNYGVNKDTTPPPAPVISSSTHPNEDNWYNNNDPTFTWTTPLDDLSGIAGYYWKVDSGSETWIASTSVTLPAQSDGTHTFYVHAKDNARNIGSYGSHEFKIDTTSPTIAITSPANGTTVTTPSITGTGTAFDASGIANVTVNGVLASGAADWSTWGAEVTLVAGENTITVVATDGAGLNTTETATVWYEPLRGDLNGDDILTPADATIALQIAVGSRPFDAAADVSDDGRVTSLDALMILQAATGNMGL